MMKFAIEIAAKNHTAFQFVQLTPAPGAASKKVIELYGGKIWLESTPGEGSIFSFTLPKQGE